MNEKSRRDRNKPTGPMKASDQEAVAAPDPKPGARNRPGFDLGGAVGNAKPDDKNPVKSSTVQAQHAVKQDTAEEEAQVTVDPQIEAEGKASRVTGKMKSAVAGVRNWLRSK